MTIVINDLTEIKELDRQAAAAVKGGGLTSAGLIVLAGAFKAGWEAGTYLDEQFDLSRQLGDKLHSWFG